MSFTSKLFLIGSCFVSGGIILYVHYKQEYDRDQLHLGVVKDLERQRRRKIENTYILQQQADLTKEYRQELLNKRSSNLEPAIQS